MATPINKFVAYNSQDIKDTNINIIEDELCGIAQMDAWHDHKTITGLSNDMIINLVNGYTNVQCGKPSRDEDAYMFSKLMKDGQDTKYCRVQLINDLNADPLLQPVSINGVEVSGLYEFKDAAQPPFTDIVSNRYKVIYCNTESNAPYSLIQAALNSQGIFDDYFLIKDTAKSDYSADIRKTGQGGVSNPDQKVCSLLTGPGIYDPGPTTTPYTQAGIDQGLTDFKKSVFGIINFNDANDCIVHYPEWKKDTYTKYEPIERLIYSKYDCKMVATTDGPVSDPKKYITQTNSTFYIKDGENVFYVNKTNSDKATDLSELAFNEKLEKIGSHRFPPGTQFPFPEASHIVNTSGIKKIFSKKVGDSGQALYTLRDVISYKEYNGQNELVDKKTNGIHGFVSYDRVAIVASIFYGAPISIFINENGFVMYISKNLIDSVSNVSMKYSKSIDEIKSKIAKIDTLRQAVNTNQLQSGIDDIRNKSDTFSVFLNIVTNNFNDNVNKISTESSRDNVKAVKFDKEYKSWLSNLYIYNQLGNAFGDFLKQGYNYDNLMTFLNGLLGEFGQLQYRQDKQEYINAKNAYDTYNSAMDGVDTSALQTAMENAFVNLEGIIKSDVDILNRTISFYNQLQSILNEISLMNDIYTTTVEQYSFDSIQGLKTTSDDEKKMNGFLKKKNAQIADSIANIRFAQALQNPSCLSSLLSCFGSSKLPYIGPFYQICKYYQYTSSIDGIIGGYDTFLTTIFSISKPQLFISNIDSLRNKLYIDNTTTDPDNHTLNLSSETVQKFETSYTNIVQKLRLVGGKKTRVNRRNNKRTIKRHPMIVKGGMSEREREYYGDWAKKYLTLNSFISILQLYKFEISKYSEIPLLKMMLQTLEENTFTKQLIQYGYNQIIDNKMKTFGYQLPVLTNIYKKLYSIQKEEKTVFNISNKTNESLNLEQDEITSFNLFLNNIYGLFNHKLFKYIMIQMVLSKSNEDVPILNNINEIELKKLETFINEYYKKYIVSTINESNFNNIIKLFMINNADFDAIKTEFNILNTIAINDSHIDTNNYLIDYLNAYVSAFPSPLPPTQLPTIFNIPTATTDVKPPVTGTRKRGRYEEIDYNSDQQIFKKPAIPVGKGGNNGKKFAKKTRKNKSIK